MKEYPFRCFFLLLSKTFLPMVFLFTLKVTAMEEMPRFQKPRCSSGEIFVNMTLLKTLHKCVSKKAVHALGGFPGTECGVPFCLDKWYFIASRCLKAQFIHHVRTPRYTKKNVYKHLFITVRLHSYLRGSHSSPDCCHFHVLLLFF